MQHFQPILIAIGILAIAGVLIHGFLLNRKNKLALLAEQEEQYDELEEGDESFNDQDKQSSNSVNRERDFDSMAFSSHLSDDKEQSEVINFNIDAQEDNKDTDPIVFQDEKDQVIDKLEPESKQHPDVNNITSVDQIISDIELANKGDIKATDPKQAIDAKQVSETAQTSQVEQKLPDELFIFNIAAKKGERLGGHELLQFFLTSGFRYGDMNIFHRHEHSDGTGEVLFSIANMMAPGTFDLDYMEQFNSPGISFFFTAPNDKISVNKSFDMMLRAVEQAAEEFDCEVLNEKREKFTPEQFMEYRQRLQQYQ
ncbi:cell division protein ZipA [Psychromonas sp. SR45-3]|uniref:cell division protein ZipA n=1 Tax=Psychromonas sp. SR45-3 TaxID=2760930 RepID=UPI0015FA1E7F|nr:cell division protein ZipA [Psychromonas sp. SR45-3]MBB1273575.1 cell division protein ZipA [Psychromonas sp. SR45-3]